VGLTYAGGRPRHTCREVVFLGMVSAEGDVEASLTRELLRRKKRDASRGSLGSFSDDSAVASG
jgi:hypothetical protein